MSGLDSLMILQSGQSRHVGVTMALKDHAPVWDDQRFIDRCLEAAYRKGWSLTQLCQKAGIAENYLVRSPAHGRNIASIMQ